jgi:hypothetical protein
MKPILKSAKRGTKMYRKQTCFDPRDPNYDGPEDDEDLDNNEPEEYDDCWTDNPADDYIMTDRELRGDF